MTRNFHSTFHWPLSHVNQLLKKRKNKLKETYSVGCAHALFSQYLNLELDGKNKLIWFLLRQINWRHKYYYTRTERVSYDTVTHALKLRYWDWGNANDLTSNQNWLVRSLNHEEKLCVKKKYACNNRQMICWR